MAGDSPRKEAPLDEVEKAQAELLRSIEESKRLAEKSQSLLDQHRKAEREHKNL